jgi:hypothetical protein
VHGQVWIGAERFAGKRVLFFFHISFLGGPDGYNTHRCNRPYEDDKGVSLQKEELARFYWHGDRYNNHARSLALELKLLAGSKVRLGCCGSVLLVT